MGDASIVLPVLYDSVSPSKRREIREEYVRRQNGLCSYCGCSLNGKAARRVRSKPLIKSLFPPNFFAHPVHLHHDHETGLTIGAVHSYCNAVLWQYENE